MPMPGYVFRDGGPIPDSELPDHARTLPPGTHFEPPVEAGHTSAASSSNFNASSSNFNTPTSNFNTSTSNVNTPTSSSSPSDAPTESHALAEADHEHKGAAQQPHFGGEVKDLGWTDHPDDVPQPLVGGLPNEELWTLVRRFNKQMYHVKAMAGPPPGGLDLNIADEDEFSPDKLRSNVERLYMTVIIGLIGFGKHIARLRSWREPRRTAAFGAAYTIAWLFNFLIPLLFTTLIVLVVYPPSRPYLFPPAPLALVNSKTGGIQSPSAGVLGSHDSLTGAPEKHQGEAVEQEASNFFSGFAHIALSSATGKHEQSDPGGDPISDSAPDPTRMAVDGAQAKNSTGGGSSPAHHDKTNQPMEEAMWTKMRPVMHVVGDISDGWERFANALSPTPPFPQDVPRYRLAAVLAPAVAISLLTTSAMFMKMTTFSIGLGFFGDPIIWRALDWLNRTFPNWQKLLELRNTVLKGVPTNAQLTITLLRIGEANKAPLPPPPTSSEAPSDKPKSLNHEDLTLDASHSEVQDAIHHDPDEPVTEPEVHTKKKSNVGAKILGVLKGTTKTGVQSKLGVDRLRAAVGSQHAKNHLGVLPTPEEQAVTGPVDFKARYKGKKGWIYISTSATIPCVSFTTHATDDVSGEDRDATLKPVFTIPIEDIQELKKIGGLGWKAKIIVGWATDKQVADGMEIVTKNGETWRITAIPLRDQLFNRLIAIGGQKWESY